MCARQRSLHAKAATVDASPWDGFAIKMRIVPINRMKRFAVSSFCIARILISRVYHLYVTEFHSTSR